MAKLFDIKVYVNTEKGNSMQEVIFVVLSSLEIKRTTDLTFTRVLNINALIIHPTEAGLITKMLRLFAAANFSICTVVASPAST